jgi:hypothetical protein
MFKKALLEKVFSGEKTQTRRDIKRRPGVQVFSVGQFPYSLLPCKQLFYCVVLASAEYSLIRSAKKKNLGTVL